MKEQVTEQDIRLPQFRDAKLEDLEFDGTGEVVRKDRFETGIKRIHGAFIERGLSSSREPWTVESVIELVKKNMADFQRLKDLILIIQNAPGDAEFYHFEAKDYVKDVDNDDLRTAIEGNKESYVIDFMSFKKGKWVKDGAWPAFFDVLVGIKDIKAEIAQFVEAERHG